MDKTNRKSKIIYNSICYSILALLFIIFCAFISLRINYLLDSDLSSEMILSNLIVDKNQFYTRDWYYSTEVRIFHMQIFMVPLFKLFSNWHLVRVLATIILASLFILALFFFMCSINQKSLFPIIASLFLLPISERYYYFIFYGLCYTQNIMLLLLILGIIFYMMKITDKKKHNSLFVLLIIISFLAGLCGARNYMNIFVPSGISAFILWLINIKKENSNYWKRLFIIVLIACVVGTVGFVLNNFWLNKVFGIASFGYQTELKLNFNINGIKKVFDGMCHMLGFNIGNNIFLRIILCILLVTMFIFSFKKSSKLNKAEIFISLHILSSLVVFVGLYSFTNMCLHDNFLTHTAILTIFVLAGIFKTFDTKAWLKTTKFIAFSAIATTFIVNSLSNYINLWQEDRTYNHREVVNVLLENKCYEGYGEFWNGNILTELSNGQISVRLFDTSKGQSNIDKLTVWLHQKSNVQTKPQGKVFVIFNYMEYENVSFAKCFNNLDYLKLDNGEIKVFIYDSYEEMIRVTGVEHSF